MRYGTIRKLHVLVLNGSLKTDICRFRFSSKGSFWSEITIYSGVTDISIYDIILGFEILCTNGTVGDN